MGASVSSNVADITNSVKNTVTNTTDISTEQVTKTKQVINLSNCGIDADNVSFKNIVTENLRSVQIADVANSNSLQNNIAQSAQQAAKSTVGSLGIGYASSSNAVAMSSNVSNAVTNALKSKQQQISMTSNYFNCTDGSRITAKNVEVENTTNKKLRQENILKNRNVNDLKTTLTQSVKQTATSTVEGATAALLAIAAIIVAIGWSFGKVVTSGAAYVKPLISAVVLIIIAVLVYVSWYNNWAPFFNVIPSCLMRNDEHSYENDPFVGQANGEHAGKCNACIDGKQNKTIYMPGCTLRYTYPLFNSGDGWGKALGINSMEGNSATILGMAQVPASNVSNYRYNNGGYNLATYNILYNKNSGFHHKFMTALQSAYDENEFDNNSLLKEMICQILSDNNPKNFAEIISVPKDNSGKYYEIPVQYQGGAIDADIENYGICTPSYFGFSNTGASPNTNWPATINRQNKIEGCLEPGKVYNLKNLNKKSFGKGFENNELNRSLLMANDNSYNFKRYFWDTDPTTDTLVEKLKKSSKISAKDKENIEDAVFGFVRFYLLNLICLKEAKSPIEYGLNTYINDYELVNVPPYRNVPLSFKAGNTKQFYKYSPNNFLPLTNSFNKQPGTLEGNIGLCNMKDLAIHKTMQKFGRYIVIVLTIGFLLLIWSAGGKRSGTTTVTRGGAALLEQRSAK
jgi:hypothetical protein